jgi:putative membrane protein insertion efficiency factor
LSHIAKFVALPLLRAYKWAISPLLPPACRYVPTCSDYAAEAVERFGAVRGGWMALTRVLRCHPLARGGYDPVVRTLPQAPGHARRRRTAAFCAGHDLSKSSI